jgi:hypothetical protein
MRNRQRGVTFLGWVFLLAPMALVVYAAIRLTPVYLEYMKIARTLEQVSEEFKGETVDAQSIRLAVERRFDIESVTAVNPRDAEALVITKDGSGYKVEAVYAEAVPFISDVSLLVEFDKVVPIE